MLYSTVLSTFTLLLSTITFLPVASASSSSNSINSTSSHLDERTLGLLLGLKQKCAEVQGWWLGLEYNFGCLCLNDLDEFCLNNGITDILWKTAIFNYILLGGSELAYPANAQPTCDGSGGYTCGSLTKQSDGSCSKTTCDSNKCSTNGGCCPRGQTYQNGQCCGSVGTSRSGGKCSPNLQCSTYKSNNICCPSGTSGWTGYKTVCCPSGQTEDSNGKCVCPAGSTKNGNTCTSNCPSGQHYGTTKCCPSGASEVNAQCVCDSKQQTLQGSGSSAKCSDRCSSGFTYYTSTCCPSGATENSKSQCECTSTQQKLTGTGGSAKCVDKCSTGFTFSTSQCCPSGSTEKNGACKCDSHQQTLQGSGNNAKCVDRCDSNSKWFTTRCCKSYLNEVNGQCVCPTSGYTDNGSKCVNQCSTDEKYNDSTKKCEKICDSSAGYYYSLSWKTKGMCCKKNYTACNSVCCPSGKEEIGETGICCVKGSKVENGKCVEPTGGSNKQRRAIAGTLFGEQINLTPSAVASYGLEANRAGKLCPAGLAACPIEGHQSEYECLDSLSDLQSCGGCASLGTGQDCTTIEGARWMGCNIGRCEVYSCRKGYTKSQDGSKCIQA